MGPLLKIFILFSFFSFTSCHYLMPSCTDGFEIYKNPIIINPKFNLKLNNGYYTNANNFNSGRYIFSNGKSKSAGLGTTTDNILTDFNNKENWADFIIINDTIIFQGFNHHNQERCRRWVLETKALITSDTTILLLSKFNYRFNTIEIFDPPILLTFFSSTIRPDSTVAWYQNKTWYKKHVHPSRK